VTVVHDRETRHETTLANAIRPVRWSRDGQTIFGTEYPDDGASGTAPGRVTACASDGPCRVLAQGQQGTPSSDDSRVFFLRIIQPGSVADRELWSVDTDGKNMQKLAVIGPWANSLMLFDVSPDNRIVRVRPWSGDHRLWLADLK
jgi:hypothetical protein